MIYALSLGVLSQLLFRQCFAEKKASLQKVEASSLELGELHKGTTGPGLCYLLQAKQLFLWGEGPTTISL